MAKQIVKIQHTSMEFSDSRFAHAHDARKIFARAMDEDIWAVTGTEARATEDRQDLRDQLVAEAHAHHFRILAHKTGEWVGLNSKFLEGIDFGFAGPFVPASHGLSPAEGAHGARGLAWGSARCKAAQLGRLSFGVIHLLTELSERRTAGDNEDMLRGAANWGRRHALGHNVAFLAGDMNDNDRRHDVFRGRPFTTIADELGKWPPTRENAVIDMISSYDPDARVKGKAYRVLEDSEYKLYTDHNLLEATYEVGVGWG